VRNLRSLLPTLLLGHSKQCLTRELTYLTHPAGRQLSDLPVFGQRNWRVPTSQALNDGSRRADNEAKIVNPCDGGLSLLHKNKFHVALNPHLHLRTWWRDGDDSTLHTTYLCPSLDQSSRFGERSLSDCDIPGGLVNDDGRGASANRCYVECSVFIDIRHAQELHERVPGSFLVREMVWLHRLDECELIVSDATDGRRVPFGVSLLDISDPKNFAVIDGELGMFPRVVVVLGCEGVDELVEAGSNVMNKFPNPHAERGVGVVGVQPSENVPLIASYSLWGGVVLELVLDVGRGLIVDELVEISGPDEFDYPAWNS